ncbi:hypothetical protein AVEN_188360-1 [Araneus ventricosus]|uniref:Uncharacterized protein n=1 Tax=Araneus ventricosus TaxID=182803 RepID=A0A4Y2PTV4_ARAVE|nr:hypothetical protein AVEN_188360-1 [Araneus ventricosus]
MLSNISLKTCRVWDLLHVRARSPTSVVRKFGDGVPAQVLSSPSDRSPKLRGHSGLVRDFLLRDLRAAGSRPNSTEDQPCALNTWKIKCIPTGVVSKFGWFKTQLHGRPALCVKQVEDQMYYNWCGIKIWPVRLAQVLSSWSDRGSKLRGPSQNSPDVPSK